MIKVAPHLERRIGRIMAINGTVPAAHAPTRIIFKRSERLEPVSRNWKQGILVNRTKVPKSSRPLSILPFPFRSITSHPSSLLASVHEMSSGVPSLFRSKYTPSSRLVSLKPFASVSKSSGQPSVHWHATGSQTEPSIGHPPGGGLHVCSAQKLSSPLSSK